MDSTMEAYEQYQQALKYKAYSLPTHAEWAACVERLRAEVAALKVPVDMEPVAYTDWTRPNGLRWNLPDSPGIPDRMPLYSAAQLAQVQRELDEAKAKHRMCEEAFEGLRSKCDAYKKDAERYRWLRIKVFEPQPWSDADEPKTPEEFDVALSAAMKKEKE